MEIGTFFSNLKNKAAYALHNAVYDADANQFAATAMPSAASEPLPSKAPSESHFADAPDDASLTGNDSVDKLLNRLWYILKIAFIPFVALMLSMYVANDMIVYSPYIRVIFFIFTFLITFFYRTIMVLLSLYYTGKGIYGYYLNHSLPDDKKIKMLPTIFALLPCLSYQPKTTVGAFLLYPFTYPKTEKAKGKLPVIMEKYLETLKESVEFIDKDAIPALTTILETLHDEPIPEPPKPLEENPPLPAVIQPVIQNNAPMPVTKNKAPMPLTIAEQQEQQEQSRKTRPANLEPGNNPLPNVIIPSKAPPSVNALPPTIAEEQQEQSRKTVPATLAPGNAPPNVNRPSEAPPSVNPPLPPTIAEEEKKKMNARKTLPPILRPGNAPLPNVNRPSVAPDIKLV